MRDGQRQDKVGKQGPVNSQDPNRAKDDKGSVRPPITPRLLTMRQAGEYLSVSYWTVRHWVDTGKLQAVRLPGDGRLVRIEVTELDRLVVEGRDN